jgi:hypothetical protein
MRVVIGNRVHHQWMGLLKVQEVRAACHEGETSKFMMEFRNEDFQDLTLTSEELLQEEPRHGTRNSDYWDSGKKLLGVANFILDLD